MNFTTTIATKALNQARNVRIANTTRRALHSIESCSQKRVKDMRRQNPLNQQLNRSQHRRISARSMTQPMNSSRMTMEEVVKALEPITRAREQALRSHETSNYMY